MKKEKRERFMKFDIKILSFLIVFGTSILLLSSCHETINIEQNANFNMYDKELLFSVDYNSDYSDSQILKLCDYKDGKIGYKITTCDLSDYKNEKVSKDEFCELDIATNEVQICAEENYYVDYYFRNPDNTITELYLNTSGDDNNYCFKKVNNNVTIYEAAFSDDAKEINHIEEVVHDNEYIYVCWENNNKEIVLSVYDYEYKLVNTYKQSNLIKCIENNIKGCFFVFNNSELYKYDGEKNKFDKLNDSIDNFDEIYSGDSLYDFYISKKDYIDEQASENYMMGCNNNTFSKLFSYEEMGLSDDYEITFSDDDGGFFAYHVGDSGNQDVYHLKKSAEKYSLKENKTLIKIATCGAFESDYVQKFNEQSEDYYVEIVDYLSENNYEEGVKKLILDAQSSDGIDLINMYDLDTEMFMQNGILENLNDSYLDKDGNVSKDVFSDAAINAMTQEDGGIYLLFNEYSIVGLWGRTDFDKTKLMNYSYDADDLVIANANISTFYDIVRFSSDRYIDLNNRTTNLYDEFKYLLQFFKAHINNSELAEYNNPCILVKEKKADLVYDLVENPYNYYFYKNVFEGDFNNYINEGIPILVPGMTELSVNINSQNKEGAYEFLNFVFDYNNFYFISNNGAGFPTMKLNEEDWKQRVTATEDYYNRYGELINAYDFSYGIGDYSCDISAVSEEEYKTLETLLNSVEYVKPLSNKYSSIIFEESNEYFEDKKSLDDTVKAIENRVTNALNE